VSGTGNLAPAVVAGLAVGVGFMIILSVAVIGLYPEPPMMFLIVEGKKFKAGYGSHSVDKFGGGGYMVDVDSSMTLPNKTINATRGSEIQFLAPGHLKPVLRQAWILEQNSHDQFFLEEVNDSTFRITDDVTDGEYIITVSALYRDGPVTSSWYNHKIHISK
jgi:hypothetical protein